MYRKDSHKRDPYAFGLGAFSIVSTFLLPMTIADNRINKAIDARMREKAATQGQARRATADRNADYGQCPVHAASQPCFCQAA